MQSQRYSHRWTNACVNVTFSVSLEMVQLLKRLWSLLFQLSHWERSHVTVLPTQCCANTPPYLPVHAAGGGLPTLPHALFNLPCQKWLCVFSPAVALQVPLILTKWVLSATCLVYQKSQKRAKEQLACLGLPEVKASLRSWLAWWFNKAEIGQCVLGWGGAHLPGQVQSSFPWQEKWTETSAPP